MINSRNKGHAFERNFAAYLRDLGFEAITSRAESREEDNKGNDIINNTPYTIQCKAAERLKMSTHLLISNMRKNGLKRPIIVHKKKYEGVTITMDLKEFEEILLAIKNSSK